MFGYDYRPNYVATEVCRIVLAPQAALYNLRHILLSRLFSKIPDPLLQVEPERLIIDRPWKRSLLFPQCSVHPLTSVDPAVLRRLDLARAYPLLWVHGLSPSGLPLLVSAA
jgi:hypothetical protein